MYRYLPLSCVGFHTLLHLYACVNYTRYRCVCIISSTPITAAHLLLIIIIIISSSNR